MYLQEDFQRKLCPVSRNNVCIVVTIRSKEKIMNFRKLLFTTLAGSSLLLAGTIAQSETLAQAVEIMLQSNPDVRSSAYNRLGRDEEVRQAQAGYLPKVDASAGYGVQDIQEPEEDTLNPELYTLSLRWNLFTGLATLNEVERQKSRVNSSAYRVQATSDQIALKTARVYLGVLRERELLQLAEENLRTHLRIADQIKLRSEAGVSSTADSEQVSGRVALAQSNVVVARTNLADAESNYLAVVGHLPEKLEEPLDPGAMLPATLEDAEKLAVESHPTLKSANADLLARQSQYEVAKAPYMPKVDIEVDQNWEKDYDTEGRNDSLVALVRLRYNLFNGFNDEARRMETTHLVSEAREIRNSTQRQVVESIRLSWMAYQAVKDRITYLGDRVNSTVATAESYTKQFNLGKRTLLDVLDTEAEVIDARKALVSARFDGTFAQYRILNGLGSLVKSMGLQMPEESKPLEQEKKEDEESEKLAGLPKASSIRFSNLSIVENF